MRPAWDVACLLLNLNLISCLELQKPLLSFDGENGRDKAVATRWEEVVADGGSWSEGFSKAQEMVGQMTIEEKVNLTGSFGGQCQGDSGGVPRLGIPGMCFNDGPSGPRMTDFITQFPSPFTVAASFDRNLIESRARAIGLEFRGKGVNVELGPVNGGPLGRSPFAGRNWEAWTPDSYLSSVYSFITVKAMQESGLTTCAKHYILYEQEPICLGPVDGGGGRTGCIQISSDVDDKTMKEVYLPSFSESVRAGTGAIMCSYNRINGTQTCENDAALNKLLKGELNFQGFVLSDFGATHSTVPSANHGMDMELANNHYYGNNLFKAVKSGKVSEKRLNDMAIRILTPYYAHHQDTGYPATNYHVYNLGDEIEVEVDQWEYSTDEHDDMSDNESGSAFDPGDGDGEKGKNRGKKKIPKKRKMVYRNEHVDNRGDHLVLARKAAAESHVLLKNRGILPIRNVKRLGVFGSDASYPDTLSGCGYDLFCMLGSDRRYWNGTVTIGGGSGATYADYIVSPLEAISQRARQEGMRIDYVLHDLSSHYPAIDTVARASEICLVFVKLFLVEGWDREHLRLDNEGEELIKTVEGSCAGEVVVVMHIGGQVIVEDWIDLPKISAVVFAGYPGQESGNALVDVLWGDVNPSGKLPFTMAKSEDDWPKHNIIRKLPKSKNPRSVFSERAAIDYKWFDTHNITPRYEFGFGLSYATFEISRLDVRVIYEKQSDTVQQTNEATLGRADLYDWLWIAKVDVTNTGDKPGAEVAQLYITYPSSETDQPPRHLRGFAKPYLLPGETKQVEFKLRKKDLSVWDVERQIWRVPLGKFVFHVGSSSRNLPETAEVVVKGVR